MSLTVSACDFSLDDLLDQLDTGASEPAPTTTTEPPVTEPPVTEPPVTEPPVTEPPVTEPAPTTVPPITVPTVPEPGSMPDPGEMADPGMAQDPDSMEEMEGVEEVPDQVPVPTDSSLTAAQAVAAESTMKVVATGCDQFGARVGSGFVVGDQLVATNAHVVAGSDQQSMVLDGDLENPLPATVVAIDVERDLALLEVPGLDRPALELDSAAVGDDVVGLGYPGDALVVEPSPATVTERSMTEFADIYYRGVTIRDIVVLAGDVDPGDSGSALVDVDGQVVGVVFGVLTDARGNELDVVLAVSDEELAAVLATPRDGAVSTGRCV
jgi:S1-C subfamily serine protease